MSAQSVKKQWRVVRGYSVKKDNDGRIVSQHYLPGPSLKEWARLEAARPDRRSDDTAVVDWLARKAARQVKVKKPKMTFSKKS
jgi:hypothetical protein